LTGSGKKQEDDIEEGGKADENYQYKQELNKTKDGQDKKSG
jgi:hypothetical protein